jgi:hypothetical protein
MDAYSCVTDQPCVCLCDEVTGCIYKVGAESCEANYTAFCTIKGKGEQGDLWTLENIKNIETI